MNEELLEGLTEDEIQMVIDFVEILRTQRNS